MPQRVRPGRGNSLRTQGHQKDARCASPRPHRNSEETAPSHHQFTARSGQTPRCATRCFCKGEHAEESGAAFQRATCARSVAPHPGGPPWRFGQRNEALCKREECETRCANPAWRGKKIGSLEGHWKRLEGTCARRKESLCRGPACL